MFTTREVLGRIIGLADFNQLINEGDPEDTVESL